MPGSEPSREEPNTPKRLSRTGYAGLLLVVLAGAGGGCASLPPVGDWSPPAPDTSPFLVRTFELRNEGSVTPNALTYAIDSEWTRLAAPADDGTVQLFDVASGQPLGSPLEGGFDVGMWTYSSGPQPFTFMFSADGGLLVWSWGKKVVAWRVETGEILLKQEIEEFKDDAVGAGVRVAPGGRFLAWTTDKGVVVWDVSDRRVATVLKSDGVCDFSADGHLLALAGSIWDLERGQPLVENLGGLCRGFSPDGRYVVTAGPTGTGLWDLTDSRALPGFSKNWPVTRPVWSADGRFLAFTNDDRKVEVWDLAAKPPTQRVLSEREKGPPGRPCWPALLLSHDGGLLSDACLITDLWDLSPPTPRLMLRTGRLPLAAGRSVLSRDGQTLAYAWGSGRRLHGGGGFGLWDVASGRPVGPRVEVRHFGSMGLSPDGRLLATAGWGPGADGKDGFVVQFWSVDALRAAGEGEVSAQPPASGLGN